MTSKINLSPVKPGGYLDTETTKVSRFNIGSKSSLASHVNTSNKSNNNNFT